MPFSISSVINPFAGFIKHNFSSYASKFYFQNLSLKLLLSFNTKEILKHSKSILEPI